MKLKHFFIPHSETHKKAHLLSGQAILVYIVLFLWLQFGIKIYAQLNPGVLGIATAISQQDVISLTNAQRAKYGLTELIEDPKLDAAAVAKGANMFAENYWAHFAPSGKSPWDFIKSSGYKFTYAGENLARNFNASSEVMDAWMNSPSHKENILNSHYTNIGIAVVNGVLNGQETTLVVQEFGRPVEYLAAAPIAQPQVSESPQASIAPTPSPVVVGQVKSESAGAIYRLNPLQKILIDPFLLAKTVGLALIAFLFSLIVIDYLVIKKRGVMRVSANHLPHLALLSVAATALLTMHRGSIL